MEPFWVRTDVVLAIHGRLIAEHGGTDGVPDPAALDSALSRPRNAFAYADPAPDIAALAAVYAFGICRNHPFVDGNKRTSLVAMRTFLSLNGSDLHASQREKHDALWRLAAGSLSEQELAEWIREHCRPDSTSE